MQVARDLVGARLIADAGTPHAVEADIVEVEAYLGSDDPASHAHRGPTPRSQIMFGEPGRLYVYLNYGIHCCANVVCEPSGRAGAVLLRAAAVTVGEAVVRRRRQRVGASPPDASSLLRGPGNLTSGLGLDRADNGRDLCDVQGRLRIAPGTHPAIFIGPRVGISSAVDLPLRYAWAGHPAVSLPRLPALPD